MLLLLSKGADPNKAAIDKDGDVFTPLNLAISSGCSTDICRSLLESGAGETPGFFGGYKGVRHVHLPFPPVLTQVTPLLAACMDRAWDLALLLLSKGADPNTAALDEDGNIKYTPLFLSAVFGSIDVCKSLLASGAREELNTGLKEFCFATPSAFSPGPQSAGLGNWAKLPKSGI